MIVRAARADDWPEIWRILRDVAAAQETFAMDAEPEHDAMRKEWMIAAPGHVIVAVDADGSVLGSANMYANRPNQGAHVASGSLVVARTARGHGVGRALTREMIGWTSREGFVAVQFNAVVSTNVAAVRLYESEGFRVIGAAPGAFRHPTRGAVDLLIIVARPVTAGRWARETPTRSSVSTR